MCKICLWLLILFLAALCTVTNSLELGFRAWVTDVGCGKEACAQILEQWRCVRVLTVMWPNTCATFAKTNHHNPRYWLYCR